MVNEEWTMPRVQHLPHMAQLADFMRYQVHAAIPAVAVPCAVHAAKRAIGVSGGLAAEVGAGVH